MPPRPGYVWGFRRPAIRAAIRSGHTTAEAIGDSLGLSRRTVTDHLHRMRLDGEVRQEKASGRLPDQWALKYPYTHEA